MTNNTLTEKLLLKSQEAFILGIEVYNKPTIGYRVEGFSFFICNAWELLLKAILIKTKGEKSIYYKNNNGRTLNLENCIKLIMTNDKDPVRLNLEQIINLRNTSTHFITEEYEQIYAPLFQSCVINYINKLLNEFNIDITQQLGSNFLTLSIKLDPIEPEYIKARYPQEIAERLLKANMQISESISSTNNANYAIQIRHDYYLTKKKSEATAIFTIAKEGEEAIKLIKSPQDMKKRCPYSTNDCIKRINNWINRDSLNFINPAPSAPEDKRHEFNKNHFDLFVKFYNLKSNPDYCYKYELGKHISYSYSEKALNLIFEEIKKDPEHIIQSLKNNIKK